MERLAQLREHENVAKKVWLRDMHKLLSATRQPHDDAIRKASRKRDDALRLGARYLAAVQRESTSACVLSAEGPYPQMASILCLRMRRLLDGFLAKRQRFLIQWIELSSSVGPYYPNVEIAF